MMYIIKIGEHCFGSYLSINDKPVIDYGYDDSKLDLDLAKLIIDQIDLDKNKLTEGHLLYMMNIISGRSKNLEFHLTDEEYESLSNDDCDGEFLCRKFNYNKDIIICELTSLIEELDSSDWNILMEILINIKNLQVISSNCDTCEQCGNYNWGEVYEMEI